MSNLEDKIDYIISGISAGMELEDMFILSGCSPREIAELKKDDFFLSRVKSTGKALELDLLKNMHTIIRTQTDKGKDHGTIWLLGKLNPRFSDKPENGDKPGIINIVMGNEDIAKMDTVEVHVERSPILNTNLHHPEADIDDLMGLR